MALNKFSKESDKVANLYRAAFYLAKGSTNVALRFLKKSGKDFGALKTKTEAERHYWAEKVLDEYTRLRYKH